MGESRRGSRLARASHNPPFQAAKPAADCWGPPNDQAEPKYFGHAFATGIIRCVFS